jgi:uncharacterized membrane protein
LNPTYSGDIDKQLEELKARYNIGEIGVEDYYRRISDFEKVLQTIVEQALKKIDDLKTRMEEIKGRKAIGEIDEITFNKNIREIENDIQKIYEQMSVGSKVLANVREIRKQLEEEYPMLAHLRLEAQIKDWRALDAKSRQAIIDRIVEKWKEQTMYPDFVYFLIGSLTVGRGVNLSEVPIIAHIDNYFTPVIPSGYRDLYSETTLENLAMIQKIFSLIESPIKVTPRFISCSVFNSVDDPLVACLITRVIKFEDEETSSKFFLELINYWSIKSKEIKIRNMFQVKRIEDIPVAIFRFPNGLRLKGFFEYFMYWQHKDKIASLTAAERKVDKYELGQQKLKAFKMLAYKTR